MAAFEVATEDLEAIVRTARLIARTIPQFDEQFQSVGKRARDPRQSNPNDNNFAVTDFSCPGSRHNLGAADS